MTRSIQLPLQDTDIRSLQAGDVVLLNGVVYTARDAAHKRLAMALANGEELPFDLKGQTLYYLGPTPARPGHVIGSAGPTTSYRMDRYTPELLANGLKGMIGKGKRGREVVEAMKAVTAVYFAATGGAAALMAKAIIQCEVVAYEDLGTEAIRRLVLENFPATVAVDCLGRNQYELGPQEYAASQKSVFF